MRTILCMMLLLGGCAPQQGRNPSQEPDSAQWRQERSLAQEQAAEQKREEEALRREQAAEREREEREAEQRRLAAQKQEREAKDRQAQAEEEAERQRFVDKWTPRLVCFEQRTLLGKARSEVIKMWGEPDDSSRTMTGATDVETLIYRCHLPVATSPLPWKTFSFVLVNGIVTRQAEY